MDQNFSEFVNKEKHIKNSALYLLPVIAGSIFPFITLPIFTRILTKEDFGVLALANVFAIFVNGLAHFGMQAAYNRNYFQYRHNSLEAAQLLYSILLFVILNFCILAILSYSFKDTFSRMIIGSSKYGDILFWALSAQFFNSINYYYLTFFKNSEIAKDFVAYTVSATIVHLAMSLFFVCYLRVGVIGLVYAQLCSGALVFSILSYKFVRDIPPSLNLRIFLGSLRIGYPLTPRIFLGVIGNQFDKYMIGLLVSFGGVGIYSIGQKVAFVIFACMSAIYNAYQPQVFKKMFERGKEGGEAVGRYLTSFAYACIAMALAVSLFSEEIIALLTPKSYHGAIDVVIVLAMYYGFLFFRMHPQLLFTKKTHLISFLSFLSIGLNVGLNIPFIMKWGTMGAAWATLIAGLVSGSVSFAVSQHYYQIKWEYNKILAIYGIFFTGSLSLILARHYSIPYEHILILKFLSTALYIYLGIKLRIISLENYLLIRNMLSLRKVNMPNHTSNMS